MKEILDFEYLENSILALEIKLSIDESILRTQLKSTVDSFKPIQLINNSLKELVNPIPLKGDIIDTSLGLAAGYLSKKIIAGSSHNPFKIVLANLLQIGITSLVSKNAVSIRALVSGIASIVSAKHKKQD